MPARVAMCVCVCMLTSCPGVWPHHSVWSPRGDTGAWPASWRPRCQLGSHWPECPCCRAPNAPDCPNHSLPSQTARLWGWRHWKRRTETHTQAGAKVNEWNTCPLLHDHPLKKRQRKLNYMKHMFAYTQNKSQMRFKRLNMTLTQFHCHLISYFNAVNLTADFSSETASQSTQRAPFNLTINLLA